MLCDNCKKNNATTHLKTIINGEVFEQHLCSDCAKEKGVEKEFNLENPLLSLMNSVFGEDKIKISGQEVKHCKGCNSTLDDIINIGKLGCADCYETFKSELLPYLKRIHGETKHIGKIAYTVNEEKDKDTIPADKKAENNNESADSLSTLKEELKNLISEEKFEQAAIVRDKIKALEDTLK